MKQKIYVDIAYDKEEDKLINCLYDESGNLCRYTIMNDKFSVQLCKYRDISCDLIRAQSALDELIRLNNDNKPP